MDSSAKAFLSNRVYDQLKFVALVGLPAIGTLYFALSQIWGFPNGAEVVGTITAVDTFLGVLLGLSSSSYNNSDAPYAGTMAVEYNEATDSRTVKIDLNDGDADFVDSLDKAKDVRFKVVR